MDRHSTHAQTTYTQVAGQWANQVQRYRRSVALFREVGVLRARRRRATPTTPASLRPARVVNLSDTTPGPHAVLRLLPPGNAPSEEPTTTTHCPLTRRQLEVAELIARGMTNGQIARELVLTPGTVANHIEHILRRLDVPNRAAAATWLARERPRLVSRSPEIVPEEADQN